MSNEQTSEKLLRRKKFLTVLPLLVIPFVTIIFWIFGGGEGAPNGVMPSRDQRINADLPGASFKEDQPHDKMSYYDRAASDSIKMKELMRNDPNVNIQVNGQAATGDSFSMSSNPGMENRAEYGPGQEQRVYEKLAQLNQTLNQTPVAATPGAVYPAERQRSGAGGMRSSDVDRLERMMNTMNRPAEPDPEMNELNGMLDKILDIQNPGRMQEQLRQKSAEKRGQVFPVTTGKKSTAISTLDKPAEKRAKQRQVEGSFYSLEEPTVASDTLSSIEAVVHETQTLVNGSTVKLRLVNDIFINGVLIPKDQFVFGMASLSGERLTISVSSIRYGNSLFAVDLTVYDLDGLDGIYVPGAISRDVAKTSADRGLQGIGINSFDPSLGMQAASVGIEAAKSFLSKKVRLIRVTVKAGYKVLLRDGQQK